MTEQTNDNAISDLWISSWEKQCIDELERSPDFECQIEREKHIIEQKLWSMFQNSALSVAQMYKGLERHADVEVSIWVPFQTAAGSVTLLYKESVDSVRTISELGIQNGYQRRTNEILSWVKRRRKHIKREDLISFLVGKPVPQKHRGSPRPRLNSERHGCQSERRSVHCDHPSETDLQTFKEALAVASLGGNMPTVGVNYRSSPSSPNVHSNRRRSPHHYSELNTFICEEFARHGVKRSAPSSPPHDVIMDSPTHKRSRYT